MNWFTENIALILAMTGIFLSIVLSGIGSAKGGAMIGQAAASLISEQPEKFGMSLVLQMMSASQGLYGFIIGFMIYNNTKGAIEGSEALAVSVALKYFAAGLIMGVAGLVTAKYQSAAATAGIKILAKKPEHATKGVLYSAMIETYAIFAFVVAILIVL